MRPYDVAYGIVPSYPKVSDNSGQSVSRLVRMFSSVSPFLGGYGTSPSYSYGAPGSSSGAAAAAHQESGDSAGAAEDLDDLYGDIEEADSREEESAMEARNPRPSSSDKYDPEEAIEISVNIFFSSLFTEITKPE